MIREKNFFLLLFGWKTIEVFLEIIRHSEMNGSLNVMKARGNDRKSSIAHAKCESGGLVGERRERTSGGCCSFFLNTKKKSLYQTIF